MEIMGSRDLRDLLRLRDLSAHISSPIMKFQKSLELLKILQDFQNCDTLTDILLFLKYLHIFTCLVYFCQNNDFLSFLADLIPTDKIVSN